MSDFIRVPIRRYQDPLSRIWIGCAERVGFRVIRTADAYASTDGRGVLMIGEDSLLDPDDSLAQMIFHELCHALVEGEDGERMQDWGLDNTSGKHTWREHACLRLQAYLADGYGLRAFFAPTTDFRVTFWSRLSDDPFYAPPEKGGRRERSCVAARLAAWRAEQPRWRGPLAEALKASAVIASVTPQSLSADLEGNAAPSLWSDGDTPPTPHPAGHSFVAAYTADRYCQDCAWSQRRRGKLRCLHAPQVKLPDDATACARWEPAADLDCLDCGACCREAYHAVEVDVGERVVKRHPDLIIHRETHTKLRRDGERCAALEGGRQTGETYACRIYGDRPKTCRDFTRGSEHCLDARRRVGLSL